MIVTALTVTRGDRPQFLQMCDSMVEAQTRLPDYHFTTDYPPKSKDNDVTERYIQGFSDAFVNYNADVVIVFEDDDYYSPGYIEKMLRLWEANGKPNAFGFDYSWYYHIGRREYTQLKHPGRSSMFNSMFTKEVLNCNFGDVKDPFLDIRLWKQLKGVAVENTGVDCIGIKHNVGLVSGAGHKKTFPYKFKDKDGIWLNRQTNNFYETYYSNTPK
jgi:hypothetical protein